MEVKIYKRTFADNGETEYCLSFFMPKKYRGKDSSLYNMLILGQPTKDWAGRDGFIVKCWEAKKHGSYFGKRDHNSPQCIKDFAAKAERYYRAWLKAPESEDGQCFQTNSWI